MYGLQAITNGAMLGCAYALLGVGMTMFLGIMRLTNLAHGELVVLGAYLSALLVRTFGFPPVATLFLTMPLMFLFGYVIQYGLINRAMFQGSESALLVTFGLSMILRDALRLIFTVDAQHIASPYVLQTVRLGPLEIASLDMLLLLIALSVIASLTLFLRFTYVGRAIRATTDDTMAAALAGIPVRRIRAIATGIAAAAAAAAGLCVGMKWTFYPDSGGRYLLISFVIVVIGGTNSVPGALLAGLVFGAAQAVGGSQHGTLISYVLLLLILAIRPQGLFGMSAGES